MFTNEKARIAWEGREAARKEHNSLVLASESRSLTADEEARVRELEAEIDRFGLILDEAAEEARAAELRSKYAAIGIGQRSIAPGRNSELRRLILGETDVIYESRAMSTGGTNVGAELTVERPSGRVWTAVEASSGIFRVAAKLPTGRDESVIVYPTITGSGTADQELAEGGTITSDDVDTDSVKLGVFRYAGIVDVSNSLIFSSSVDVEQIVRAALGRRRSVP